MSGTSLAIESEMKAFFNSLLSFVSTELSRSRSKLLLETNRCCHFCHAVLAMIQASRSNH